VKKRVFLVVCPCSTVLPIRYSGGRCQPVSCQSVSSGLGGCQTGHVRLELNGYKQRLADIVRCGEVDNYDSVVDITQNKMG
jgi:hypothetical protein